ncbi:uncharacterized protein METZ01_LOCUS96847 [marine metagenome]|uniref:L-seryl-tRNA selenium transferase N-terminal domain-containing protein n=1 Tax=marine metagenome TaxID=408172 RepID=A0A381VWK7_9ZZZZ
MLPQMNNFRKIPSVDVILQQDDIKQIGEEFNLDMVTLLIREVLTETRKEVSEGQTPPLIESIVKSIVEIASTRWRTWPEAVINATGVILHTNLGRAPLSKESILSARRASEGYSDLELDLATGKRGSRQAQVSQLICDLVGSEAAIIVNNNAAALILGLAAIANGKGVIVSRSEAVEIGGGFRIPDVLAQSGSRLVEVGTTNRTYSRDFESAIDEDTGALLSVHASNFKIVGFTHSPKISELVEVGNKSNVPVLHDVGSGCIVDATKYGLAKEPMPQESVDSNVDLCFFSADKLLGGPQAGIVVGKKHYIQKLSSHPLARAFRIDKMSLAALNETLLHYLRGEIETKIPVWQMISATVEDLSVRSKYICESLGPTLETVKSSATVGGGSLPGEHLDSVAISIKAKSPNDVGRKLREANYPVVGRIEDDRFILDLRTVLPEQDPFLVKSLKQILV